MSTENQMFNGIKFYKRTDNLYWYSTTRVNGKRVYMHKYVWEYYNSTIPKGYEVHHIDLNRDNNNIENLQLLTIKEHKDLHSALNKSNEETVKKWKGNLKLAIDKAKEWHKSEVGKRWHSEHARNIDYSKINYGERTCIVCGTTYLAKNTKQRFCSQACKSKFYRLNKKNTML